MFERDAIERLNDLFKTHNIVVMVGGSGLYVKAVTGGLDDFPEIDITIRKTLNKRLETEGIECLQNQLKVLDKESYQTISIDNPHRVIRALEICLGTGKPYSSFLGQKKNERNFNTITIGLTADRDIIYNRINQRVDIMLKEGLLEEIKALQPHQKLNALNTVGYKELFNYLNGKWTLDFSISEIKKNTRRFAKRQLTWFRKQEDILWFRYNESIDSITKELNKVLK